MKTHGVQRRNILQWAGTGVMATAGMSNAATVPQAMASANGSARERANKAIAGGGTHTGAAFSDFLLGSLPAATGRTMRFSGTTVLRIANGRIVEEIGLDDGVTAQNPLGLVATTRA